MAKEQADAKAEKEKAYNVTLTGGIFPAVSIPGLKTTKNLTKGQAVRCSASEVEALKKGIDQLPVELDDFVIDEAK